MNIIAGNKYLKKEDQQVFIDSVPLGELIEKYKTPIIIFLENRIRDNIKTFINVFRHIFDKLNCLYSFKANYIPEICKIIRSEDVGAEIVGLPELKLALNLKFPPNKIIGGGPYLPKKLIEKCIENKIKEIIIYNLNDLKKVDLIAKKYNHIQDICIRINSRKYNSKLGVIFDEQNLLNLRRYIKECKNIKLTTILSHYSTQMNNIELFIKNVETIAKNLKILAGNGIKIKNINLGGGFPEAVVMNQRYLKKLALRIKSFIKEHNIPFEYIYFEPGRYFVGDAGLFIAKIIKVSKERYVFLNIGNHICPKFAKCSLRFYNASRINVSHNEPTSFLGNVPTDQDVLAKNYFFTEYLREGDFVLVTNVGAYCLTFSNRFPYSLPKILLIKDRDIKQIFDPYIDKDFSIN